MERSFLEAGIAEGKSLAELGREAGKHPSTVAYWIKRYRLTASGADRHSPRGGLATDQLAPLVQRGLTIRQIAEELDRSFSTVRYWLARYGLETDRGNRRALRRAARAEGRTRVLLECRHHGVGEFHLERSGRFRCVRCRIDAVMKRRRKMKKILVEEAGGSCRICGYDRCLAALQFHHLDPRQKRFVISLRGATRSLQELRDEASKCILLCANCHAEVEVGLRSVPV